MEQCIWIISRNEKNCSQKFNDGTGGVTQVLKSLPGKQETPKPCVQTLVLKKKKCELWPRSFSAQLAKPGRIASGREMG
jgi:hypothetical protein